MGLRNDQLAPLQVQEFRRLLETRRREIEAQLLEAAKGVQVSDEPLADVADQASAELDRNLAMTLNHREAEHLKQIYEALRRVDRGNFGICDECGAAISEGRMRAFPFTTLCIDCKAELEFERKRTSRILAR